MISQRTWRWLAVFVVVDIVLVIVMLRHMSSDSDPRSADPSSTGGTTPTADVPAPEPTSAPLAWVESNGDVTAWAPRGDCAAGESITVTRDVGGEREVLEPGVTEVLRLDVGQGGDLYVIGADAQCRPIELSLGSGGTQWSDPAGPIRRWHLTPQAPTVTTPAGIMDPGCAPVTLVADGVEGMVGCSDGRVLASTDDGRTWTSVGQLDGLTSLVADDDGPIALAPGSDCPVAAHRVDDGDGEEIGCVSTMPGSPALLARSGDGLVVVLGEALLVSDDAVTWRPAS